MRTLQPTEGARFRSAVKVSLHPYDVASLDRLCEQTNEQRAECGRRLLRLGLQTLDVPPYAGEHEVQVECPVCRTPAALTVWVSWDAGAPELGMLPGWKADTHLWFDSQDGDQNPVCGCTPSESDIIAACERAVEQFEARLLSGEARENAGVKP